MHRRNFMTLIWGMVSGGLSSAFAQSASVPTVGFVNNGSPKAIAGFLGKFREGLAEAGFVEGQTVAIETRLASSAASLGRDAEAKAAAEALLGLDLQFSIGRLNRRYPFGMRDKFEPFYEGLRRAGVRSTPPSYSS